MPFKTKVNWLYNDIIDVYNDVIELLVILTEKLAFFNKHFFEVYCILKSL